MKFHAVMIDETGCEFGVDIETASKQDAIDQLEEDYPESRVDQVESASESREREGRMYAHIEAGGDWDDDGRPFNNYSTPSWDIDEDDY